MLTPCMIMLTPLVAYFNKPTSVLVLRDLRPSVLVNKETLYFKALLSYHFLRSSILNATKFSK